jgi:hypothetical protein
MITPKEVSKCHVREKDLPLRANTKTFIRIAVDSRMSSNL